MMQIERVPIESLVLDPANARGHDERNLEAIKASLSKFGQQKPIVVGGDNVVIAGNGTLTAARALGWKDIDIHRTVLKGAEAVAYAIADNRTAELADWENDTLAKHLDALAADGWDLGDLGFTDDDLKALDTGGLGTEGNTDPDDVPEVEENKFGVSRGQIWQLGEHRLMCGDSTSKDDVEKLMGGEKADMVFTDPPYGLNFSEMTSDKGSRYLRHGHAKDIIGNQDTSTARATISLVLNLNVASIIWGANHYCDALPPSTGWIAWDKQVLDKSVCFSDGEIAWTNIKKPMRIFRHVWDGFRKDSEKGERRLHISQKPIPLAEWCFENYGDPKSVLDLFLGSGSTLIACEKTGRKCYGMEIDPHYCSVIIERWQNFTGKEAELISDDGGWI